MPGKQDSMHTLHVVLLWNNSLIAIRYGFVKFPTLRPPAWPINSDSDGLSFEWHL